MGREKRNQRSTIHRNKGIFLVFEHYLALTCFYIKYSTNYKERNNAVEQKIMYAGNSNKSLYLSVESSLKKLRTEYIDLLYVHWYDWHTSIEEIMRSLHALVMQRKVLYLVCFRLIWYSDFIILTFFKGISDSPAWVVAKANQYARDHALTPFVVYQGRWNIMDREFEREIIPMARSEGLALAPWAVLAGGKIRTDAEEERRRQTGEKGRVIFEPSWERNDHEKAVCRALEKVAFEIGAKNITSGKYPMKLHANIYLFERF